MIRLFTCFCLLLSATYALAGKPYQFKELTCADALKVDEFLNHTRRTNPNPTATDHKILEGIRRYLEVHEITLSRKASHLLGLALLNANPDKKSSAVVIEEFLRSYGESLVRGEFPENEIDWKQKRTVLKADVAFFSRNVKIGPTIVMKAWVDAAANRLGAIGRFVSADIDKGTVVVHGNSDFVEYLLETKRFKKE